MLIQFIFIMKKYIFVIFLFVTLFTSCKKEVGPQGLPGNANVKTTMFTVSANQWLITPESPTNAYTTELSVNDITPDIMDAGSVDLFFWSGGSKPGWSSLPQSNPYHSIYFTYSVSKIIVIYMYPDSSLVQNPGQKEFKVVVISGH